MEQTSLFWYNNHVNGRYAIVCAMHKRTRAFSCVYRALRGKTMNEFIKLIEDGYKVSIHAEKEHGDYVFEFKKGNRKIKLIKLHEAFNYVDAQLIFNSLAKLAKEEFEK